ncbi:probable LRR receptor-like serine/threonine-protein kinase at2g16250 [Phtheirospermum japonicum]|uniref:Probable LRR receptor-like serine/threonine-protein kinase at2g16250 n=1 Tax=Phtheirospermum japonicum TaxID=374723 RepID=A0A830CK04_9LAMI|nr:probable LRR receptor-like serine/threonine-protein kinase at2g16250 [Phtheirospermum japonicum]
MSAIYDSWERLVDAVLLREKLRYLGRIDSRASSESAGSFRLAEPPTESTLNTQKLGYKFTHRHLLKATGNFSDENLIKRGSSGDFFRGDYPNFTFLFTRDNKILGPDSNIIVIKRIDLDLVGNREAYLYELDFLTKVWNVKFFPLLGRCLEKENEKFLVYKLMPNGDLSSSLFKKNVKNTDGLTSLDWITRMKIAVGAAEGLAYLHQECNPSLVHGDVQASSILLDDNYEVRLGSLSQAGAQQSGHHNHDDWESDKYPLGTPEATCANDVHCFGKVLLELVTGKLVDPSLIVDEDLLEEVWSMAIVAKSCLDPDPKRRPLMTHILKALENPLELPRAAQTGYKAPDSSTASWTAAILLNILPQLEPESST